MLTEEIIKKNFGIIVKELRTHKGLTQEKLAEFIDVQTQTISAIESGRSFISCEVLTKLSNFFEIDPSIFFTKKPDLFTKDGVFAIDEIKRILPLFTPTKLKEIYDILLVMHK